MVVNLANGFGSEAGYRTVELFMRLLGGADAGQGIIKEELAAIAERHFESAATVCADPLRVARAARQMNRKRRTNGRFYSAAIGTPDMGHTAIHAT